MGNFENPSGNFCENETNRKIRHMSAYANLNLRHLNLPFTADTCPYMVKLDADLKFHGNRN